MNHRCITALTAVLTLGALAHAGSITGTVTFEGKPPALKPVNMSRDPACVATTPRGILPT